MNCFSCRSEVQGFGVFCSSSCREAYRLEQLRLQAESNLAIQGIHIPHVKSPVKRVWKLKTVLPGRVCAASDCSLPYMPRHPKQLFCSRKCKQRIWARKHYRQTYIPIRVLGDYTCESCGGQFQPYRRGQRFCSIRCNQRVWHRKFREEIQQSPILLAAFRERQRCYNRRHYAKISRKLIEATIQVKSK